MVALPTRHAGRMFFRCLSQHIWTFTEAARGPGRMTLCVNNGQTPRVRGVQDDVNLQEEEFLLHHVARFGVFIPHMVLQFRFICRCPRSTCCSAARFSGTPEFYSYCLWREIMLSSSSHMTVLPARTPFSLPPDDDAPLSLLSLRHTADRTGRFRR